MIAAVSLVADPADAPRILFRSPPVLAASGPIPAAHSSKGLFLQFGENLELKTSNMIESVWNGELDTGL
jgi:hypothetical protein